MKPCLRAASLIMVACLLLASLPAEYRGQQIQLPPQLVPDLRDSALAMNQARWVVAGKVKTVHGDLVRGANVIVTPLFAANQRMVTTDAGGEFRTEYFLRAGTVGEFIATITVKLKGFQTSHAYVNYGSSGKSWWVPITLHEARADDPELLLPADLVSALSPKLRQLGPGDGLAEKSAKDYARGVTAFLDQQNVDRAVPLLARVADANASCVGCRTLLGAAELAWCDWDGAREAFALSLNAILHDAKLERPEPFVAYGTWLNWQYKPEEAVPYFQRAVKVAPREAVALQELGRTLLLTQQFEAANDTLKQALTAGAGPEARLLYAESSISVGRYGEAATELNHYLGGRDIKNMPLRVRKVWASLQDQKKVDALRASAMAKPRKGHELIDLVRNPPAALITGIEPARDQDQLGAILDGVGANILELSKNFPNTTSLEAVRQEKLTRKGTVRDTRNEKYRYLCLASTKPLEPGFLESRQGMAGNTGLAKDLAEGFMLTNGFTSAALVFHPHYRSESTFRYLGQQAVDGKKRFVVAFAQIPATARLTGTFQSDGGSSTTYTQGLAWIDPASFRIARLYTELLAPIPSLRVEKESTDIDFSEVHFKQSENAWWLPRSVTVSLEWNGKVLRNRHVYSDFRLFDVEATEKIENPEEPRESIEPLSERKMEH